MTLPQVGFTPAPLEYLARHFVEEALHVVGDREETEHSVWFTESYFARSLADMSQLLTLVLPLLATHDIAVKAAFVTQYGGEFANAQLQVQLSW